MGEYHNPACALVEGAGPCNCVPHIPSPVDPKDARIAELEAALAERDRMLEPLLAIAGKMQRQDNLATGNPIFTVQQRRRDYGYDPIWGGEMVWLDEDGDEQPQGPSSDYERTQWNEAGYKDRLEFVTACLTRKGCEDYIALNGHNLTDPTIFVESGNRNVEWATLRKTLADLRARAEERSE